MSLNLQYENMRTAAVEVVGAVCRRLTWSRYLYYLKHFVHILQTSQTEQKLAVRWVTALNGYLELIKLDADSSVVIFSQFACFCAGSFPF